MKLFYIFILLISLSAGVYADDKVDWPIFSGDDTSQPLTDYLQIPDLF